MQLILTILLVICSLINCWGYSGSIYIAFRNDDLSANSNPDFEYQVLQIFHKQGIKPLYAVIPVIGGKVLEPGMPIADSLKSWYSKGWIDLAMHGYTHEHGFSSYSFEDQQKKIAKGEQILEKALAIKVQFFCPPWNSSDQNTITALKVNEITGLSGYLGEITIEGIKFINCNCNLFNGPLGNFSEKLEVAQSSGNENLIIPLFHTNYDFNEENLIQLDSLLSNLITGAERIKVVSFSELSKDENYTELLNESNRAGNKLKTLKYNKYNNKIFSKIPIVSNLYRNKIHRAQISYEQGNYTSVSQIYNSLLLELYVGFIFLLITFILIAVLLKKLRKK